MAQISITVRMDASLKAAFDELCSQFGMSVNTAMNIFAKAVVRERAIPFEIKAAKEEPMNGLSAFYALRDEAQRNGVPEMSLEEINQEISLARSAHK